MLLAGEWYQSGTFWSAVAAIAAVVTVPVSLWLGTRAGQRNRQLTYSLISSVRLLGGTEEFRGTLQVIRNGAVLSDPHIAHIVLINDGRLDISSDLFDENRPISLNVGAPILELLDVHSRPTTTYPPAVTVSGAELLVGPSLFVRGQRLTLSVLLDTPVSEVTCLAPIVDLHRIRDNVPNQGDRYRQLRERGLHLVVCLWVIGLLIIWLVEIGPLR